MTTIAIVCILATAGLTAQQVATTSSADAALERGLASFRAGNHQSAVEDLQTAAQGYLTPEQMRTYVDSGRLETLPRLETALIYLAMAQSHLGRTDDARNTILRLMTAERIEPTYSALQLESDAREFETMAASLVPSAQLPSNVSFGTPLPPVRIAEGTVPPATPVITEQPTPPAEDRTTTATEVIVADTTPAAVPAAPLTSTPAPATVTIAEATPPLPPVTPAPTATDERPAPPTMANGQPLIVQPTIAQERAERQRLIDELVARERVKIQREADERVAAVERSASERVASAERAAQEQVAAATRAAQEQIAAAERTAQERIATEQRATAERLEAERVVIQRAADERVAAERAAAERRTAELVASQAAAQTAERRNMFLSTLRQADAFAANERLTEANEMYNRVASTPDVPREFLSSAAIGLYRTGAFRDAVKAFSRLAPYQRGEEDLRYYHAVALYETGNYSAAQKELACAVPFIQVTEDVARYREKIEQTVAHASR